MNESAAQEALLPGLWSSSLKAGTLLLQAKEKDAGAGMYGMAQQQQQQQQQQQYGGHQQQQGGYGGGRGGHGGGYGGMATNQGGYGGQLGGYGQGPKVRYTLWLITAPAAANQCP